jgi:hypothetical protein
MNQIATTGRQSHGDFGEGEQRQLTGRLRAAITEDPPEVKTQGHGAAWLAHALRAVLICALAVFALKSVLLYRLGPALYASRCVELSQGSRLDRVGAIVMAPDQVSLFASEAANRLFAEVSSAPQAPMLSPTLQAPMLSPAPQAPMPSPFPQGPRLPPTLEAPTASPTLHQIALNAG